MKRLEEAIAKLPEERQQEIKNNVNEALANQYRKIIKLLPDDLFSGSKCWRDGDTVERVEWLISMYKSKAYEVEHWIDQVAIAKKGNQP